MEILEYWPIILGVLYYLFRSGKNKEKESRRRAPSDDVGEPMTTEDTDWEENPVESILDEIRRIQESQKKKIESKPEPQPIEPPVVKKPKPKSRKTMEERRIESVVAAEEKRLAEEAAQEEEKVEFDLRQAVINDAILNRPWK
jgi:hypothetical protein